MKLDEQAIPKAVKNEWFYLFARFCMVTATLIGLPIAGAMLSRVINTADAIEAAVNKQAGKLDLLSLKMEMQFAQDEKEIRDHEARIRQIEVRK